MGDLLGRVDVEGGGVVDGECCEIDSVAVKGVIAIGERTAGELVVADEFLAALGDDLLDVLGKVR